MIAKTRLLLALAGSAALLPACTTSNTTPVAAAPGAVSSPAAQPETAANLTFGTHIDGSGMAGFPTHTIRRPTPAPTTSNVDPRPVRVGASSQDETGPGNATVNVTRVSFAEEGADFDPCVSPDGGLLVYASTQHRQTSDLYAKRVNSRVVTQLTNDPADDAMPAVSPDGTRIAFASNRAGNWDIYVMPVNGGNAVQITDDPADEINPSWSPDGRSLVFGRGGNGGRWEMWVADTSNPSVSHFIGHGLFPQWCPIAATGTDGADRILYQLGRERGRRSFALWTIDFKNGNAFNATEIVGSAETALINPAWSPDGEWVVYAEAPVEPATEISTTLWMVHVEGDGKVRLTTGDGTALDPYWGAGNRLFFVSNRSGTDNIWSMDLGQAVRSASATLNQGAFATGSNSGSTHASTDKQGKGSTANGHNAVANVPETPEVPGQH